MESLTLLTTALAKYRLADTRPVYLPWFAGCELRPWYTNRATLYGLEMEECE